MQLFRRHETNEEDEVRWLTPTQVRQRPRRRLLPFGLLTAAVIAAGGLVAVSLRLSGPSSAVVDTERAPSPAARSVQPTPRVEQPAPGPSPIKPLPQAPAAPQQSAETTPQTLAPAPEVAPTAPEQLAPPTATEPQAPAAPASDVTGAFPPANAQPAEDGDGADFAAYLNESAPDQNAARTLVVEAQRRYGAALGGGRLSYRRVRVSDGSYVWRLRLSGLTRDSADRVCAALKAEGAGCEVGPR